MKLIPPYINHSLNSNAERKIFNLLSNATLNRDYYCLHSVNLPQHQYKVSGELDFVLISTRGVYVIEVKGGRVSRQDGIWHYIDRWGTVHKNSEGPFKQAESGMFTLREKLIQKLPANLINKITFGFGVIFPDCDFNQRSIEWDQVTIADSDRLNNRGIEEFIESLETYWHAKLSKSAKVDPTDAKKIVELIRPDFEMAVSINTHIQDIDKRVLKFTQEQYERLDLIQHCPRILVEGAAGTGKTFLAIETARRHVANKERTLLICFSPILANYIGTHHKDDGFDVFSLHDLMIMYTRKSSKLPPSYYPGRDITDDWFKDELTPIFEECTQAIPEDEKYDVIIIDEGQDILNLHYVMALDNILKDGLENGKWRIFFDPFNQGALFGAIDDDVLQYLKQFGPVPPKLQINCRNTDPILEKTKLITGADLGTKSTGPGPEVTMEWYADQSEQIKLLQKYIHTLRNQGVADSDITILSPHDYDNSVISNVEGSLQRQIKILDGNIKDVFPFSKITFCRIAEFKGLENRFILLVDVETLNATPRDAANVYVGLTRAKAKLWIALSDSLRNHYQEISSKHQT